MDQATRNTHNQCLPSAPSSGPLPDLLSMAHSFWNGFLLLPIHQETYTGLVHESLSKQVGIEFVNSSEGAEKNNGRKLVAL